MQLQHASKQTVRHPGCLINFIHSQTNPGSKQREGFHTNTIYPRTHILISSNHTYRPYLPGARASRWCRTRRKSAASARPMHRVCSRESTAVCQGGGGGVRQGSCHACMRTKEPISIPFQNKGQPPLPLETPHTHLGVGQKQRRHLQALLEDAAHVVPQVQDVGRGSYALFGVQDGTELGGGLCCRWWYQEEVEQSVGVVALRRKQEETTNQPVVV